MNGATYQKATINMASKTQRIQTQVSPGLIAYPRRLWITLKLLLQSTIKQLAQSVAQAPTPMAKPAR